MQDRYPTELASKKMVLAGSIIHCITASQKRILDSICVWWRACTFEFVCLSLHVSVWYGRALNYIAEISLPFSISFDKMFLNRYWFSFQGKGNMKSSWIFYFNLFYLTSQRACCFFFLDLIRPHYTCLSFSCLLTRTSLTFFNCLPRPCWFLSPGDWERGWKEETAFGSRYLWKCPEDLSHFLWGDAWVSSKTELGTPPLLYCQSKACLVAYLSQGKKLGCSRWGVKCRLSCSGFSWFPSELFDIWMHRGLPRLSTLSFPLPPRAHAHTLPLQTMRSFSRFV